MSSMQQTRGAAPFSSCWVDVFINIKIVLIVVLNLRLVDLTVFHCHTVPFWTTRTCVLHTRTYVGWAGWLPVDSPRWDNLDCTALLDFPNVIKLNVGISDKLCQRACNIQKYVHLWYFRLWSYFFSSDVYSKNAYWVSVHNFEDVKVALHLVTTRPKISPEILMGLGNKPVN